MHIIVPWDRICKDLTLAKSHILRGSRPLIFIASNAIFKACDIVYLCDFVL